MEEAVKKKGTVTPISSLFSPEETQKASERVKDKIAERRKQLDILKGFISDNTDLINLVQTLPNELQHEIMVPWGKAAFFPGQLIHTNEFMVLLGDGYYAERTSKQTVEILNRRQKVLESQVEAAKADIQDLKTEISFFNATADEAASGLVQIVEDYAEERPLHEASISGEFHTSSEAEQERTENEDDEYERIFSRLAELEKEEEAAENELSEDDFDHGVNQLSKQLPMHEDVSSHAGAPTFSKSGSSMENSSQLPVIQQNVQAPAVAKHEVSSKSGSSMENSSQLPVIKQNVKAPAGAKHEVPVQPVQPSTSSSKAFTGSIVEHTHNLQTNAREETVAASSKPVSRFKMNRK